MMRRGAALLFALASLAALAAAKAGAHDGVVHADPAEAAALAAPSPFPVTIAARFDLVDQTGARRTEADFAGRPMLLFFGYAQCEAICSVALPRMAETLDLLGDRAAEVAPVLITVDPARDTPEALAAAAPRIHPRLVALTGDETALAAARGAFQVSAEVAFEDPAGQPVYSHGSFIYLVGADGKVLTLLPPVLGSERMAEIVASYL